MATKNTKTKARKSAKSAKAKATKTVAKVERVKGGGNLTRPSGDITGRIWDIADGLLAKTHGKEVPTRAQVMEACDKQKVGAKAGTLSTQYQRWRVFNKLAPTYRRGPSVPKPPKARNVPKPPKAAKKAAAKKPARKMASKPKVVPAVPRVPAPPAA